MTPVEEIDTIDPARFEGDIVPAYRPVVIRGLARDWPLVQAGRRDAREAMAHLAQFDSGALADVMLAPPSQGNRFFYDSTMRGFNFKREKASLRQVCQTLLQTAGDDNVPSIYAGAAPTAEHFPGFDAANALPIAADQPGSASRIWISGAAQVATHYDLSDNIAVAAFGRRRFTLFPPEATANLYVGPLNFTLAGQPVSMVDPLDPDEAAYPDYRKAENLALQAELGPGDALYIPTLWWHHVQATDPINILVNYWFNHAPQGGPFIAFVHALSEIRDLPPPQRAAWRHWFDHFVFGDEAHAAADHLSPHARGVQGPPSKARSQAIRDYVRRALDMR